MGVRATYLYNGDLWKDSIPILRRSKASLMALMHCLPENVMTWVRFLSMGEQGGRYITYITSFHIGWNLAQSIEDILCVTSSFIRWHHRYQTEHGAPNYHSFPKHYMQLISHFIMMPPFERDTYLSYPNASTCYERDVEREKMGQARFVVSVWYLVSGNFVCT